MDDPSTLDTPLHRITIDELPENIATAHLERIREHRMRARRVYEENVAAKNAARADRAREQMEDQLRMLQKELEQLDKVVEKLEKRTNKVRALRLELEDLEKPDGRTTPEQGEPVPTGQDVVGDGGGHEEGVLPALSSEVGGDGSGS